MSIVGTLVASVIASVPGPPLSPRGVPMEQLVPVAFFRSLATTMRVRIPILARALDSDELDTVRRAAAELASAANPHVVDEGIQGPCNPSWQVGRLWREPAQSALERGLLHADEEVRALMAFTWMRLGARAQGGTERLERLSSEDPSAAVRFFAREALRRRESPAIRWLERLAAIDAGAFSKGNAVETWRRQLLDDPEEFAEAGGSLDDVVARDRFSAVAAVARTRLADLLRQVSERGSDTLRASATVGALEFERSRYVARLLERHGRESFGKGPATDELTRLAAAAVPELTAYVMLEPRFPDGSHTYLDLAPALEAAGSAMLASFFEALFHWRSDVRDLALERIESLGEALPAVVPLLVARWRLEDERDPRVVARAATDPFGLLVLISVPETARPFLEPLLDDPHSVVQAAAARCLLSLGATGDVRDRAQSIVAAASG